MRSVTGTRTGIVVSDSTVDTVSVLGGGEEGKVDERWRRREDVERIAGKCMGWRTEVLYDGMEQSVYCFAITYVIGQFSTEECINRKSEVNNLE